MSAQTPAPTWPARPGPARPWRWWGLLVLLGLGACPLRAEVTRVHRLKAAYLYNFTKFVEWPESRFRDGQSPIVIGVLGRNPFGDELEKIVQDRTVHGRPILVQLITTAVGLRDVHVLYVPAGEETRPEFAAVIAERLPLLTAGESGPFQAAGGVITFTQAGDKLRFTINLDSSERAGLKLSAQLLKLATIVRRSP